MSERPTRCHPSTGAIQIGEEEMMTLPVLLDGDDKRRNYTTKTVYNYLSHDDWTPDTTPKPATFAAC